MDRPIALQEQICPGMVLLRDAASAEKLKPLILDILEQAPLRYMTTPGGHSMSASMSNCGTRGWVTDRQGYRYTEHDPKSGELWPAMPPQFSKLAASCAAEGGYPNFKPDACLINCYEPGAGMGSHQDKDEKDFSHPIVSVSLGLPARFFVQGKERRGRSIPVDLVSGDVVVWGGPSRLWYHGVRPLKAGFDTDFGAYRFNLTFRRASD